MKNSRVLHKIYHHPPKEVFELARLKIVQLVTYKGYTNVGRPMTNKGTLRKILLSYLKRV